MNKKEEQKAEKTLDERNGLNDLKQFILKNKKENLILKKILKIINQSSKSEETDNSK